MVKGNITAPGKLIVLEGIDGTGKSTLIRRLAAHCLAHGIDCLVSGEPTHGQWGRRLRESARSGRLELKEELELFIKDRTEHVEQVIRPARAAGQVVLLDRYYFSTAAYQGARGADPEKILAANEQFAPIPDLVLLLDLPPNIAMTRITHRGDEPDAFEALEYQEKVRRIFLSIRRPMIRVIDAARDLEAVWRDCYAHFTRVLRAEEAK